MSLREVAKLLPAEVSAQIEREGGALTEVRLRAGRPVQLVSGRRDYFCGEAISPERFRRLLGGMMEHSYYAREEELAQGFFTMRDGCRVGVCGAYVLRPGGGCSMRAIGSACIRVAREVRGCAEEAVAQMLAADARGMLLLSRPGLGKTTMLRDAARLLSERGFSVGIADERHELAACMDGVPTLDVGARSDVADGCPKSLAMERLVRSMAPDVIVTDEIGNARDAQVLRETARRGVRLVASAHASGFGDLRGGMLGALAKEGVFSIAVLLDGAPGQIAGIRSLGGAA